MSVDKWKSLMARLGTDEHMDMYESLIHKYSEKHRCYHTLEHVKFCLALLEEYRYLAINPDEIELAIWFHDAVYNVFSSTNEKNSADMAFEFSLSAGLSSDMATRISDLVIATTHGTEISNPDQCLMVDIDLSVLGCSAPLYEEFEIAVRKEYKKIPLFIFRKGRRKILNSFLSRASIYMHPEFIARYEVQARANIKNAVNNLY